MRGNLKKHAANKKVKRTAGIIVCTAEHTASI